MNNKLFFAIGLAATLLQAPVTVSAQSSGTSQQNPLLMKSNLPFGAPDFSRIKESDYLPAIEAAIKIKRDNIQKIVDNKKKPTFQNTILAFEESGILLDRVCSVFFGLTNADKTPVLAEAEDKVMPLLTGLENEISFNQQLFERIKFVYDNEYAKLKGEDQRLTEEIYKSFVRSGALLSAEKMARMKEINSRISELQQQWGNLLPEATNHAGLITGRISLVSARPTLPSARRMRRCVVARPPIASLSSIRRSNPSSQAFRTVRSVAKCSRQASIVPTAPIHSITRSR